MLPAPVHVSGEFALLVAGSQRIQTASKDRDVTIGPCGDPGGKGAWGILPSSALVICWELMNPSLSSWLSPSVVDHLAEARVRSARFMTEVSV